MKSISTHLPTDPELGNEAIRSTPFAIANTLARRGNIFHALLIYDYLRNTRKFSQDDCNYKDCELRLRHQDGRRATGKARNEKIEAYVLRVSDEISKLLRKDFSKIYPEIFAIAKNHEHYELYLANRHSTTSEDKTRLLNSWLRKKSKVELTGVTLREDIFDSIKMKPTEEQKYDDSEKVSIAMSCRDAAETIEYAATSALNQTHTNIELVIIDDASTDATWKKINQLAEADSRITAIRNRTSVGTYANRNLALSIATGKYFTVIDADDFHFPNRIARQVSALQLKPESVAVISEWIRITPDGTITPRANLGGFSHRAVASLLYKKSLAIQNIGYYDEVRFGADMEHLQRLIMFFGREALIEDRVPVAFARQAPGSLTTTESTGVDAIYGSSIIRREYRRRWEKWHSNSKSLFMPFRANEYKRPFSVPNDIL